MDAIYNLTESHSPGLRIKTVCHHEKLQNQESETNSFPHQFSSKDVLMIKCPLVTVENKISQMLKYLEEMPEGKGVN